MTVTTIFECAWALRGYDRLLMDMLLNPDLADRILDIPYHYHLAAAKRLVEMGVDMIWLGDDVGGQAAMLMSPALWRRFLKPRMARLIAALKAINPELKVAYHSDGSDPSHHPRPDRDRPGCAQPGPTRCHGPRLAAQAVRRHVCASGVRSTFSARCLSARPQTWPPRCVARMETLGDRRRPDHRAHPQRPARHAHGELLGHGEHHHPHDPWAA